MLVYQFIRGFFMAIADSIPGVSGGTIAFIMGFYDQLIQSLNDLIHGPNNKRLESLMFLIKIGIGWFVGIILSILFIASVFEVHIYSISSLFIGLILGAIPLIFLQEKVNFQIKLSHMIFTLIGMAIVILITYYNPFNSADASYSVTTFGQYFYISLAGMVAISAMILPGISGSTILLIMGVYHFIILNIDQFIRFNFSGFFVLVAFGIGILLGLAITIRFVNYAFKHHRSMTLYTIIGLMIGSIYAIIMGPKTVSVSNDVLNSSNFSIFFFLLGGAIIFGLEHLRRHFEIS